MYNIHYTLSVYAMWNTLNTVYSIQCIEYVLYIICTGVDPAEIFLIQLQSWISVNLTGNRDPSQTKILL